MTMPTRTFSRVFLIPVAAGAAAARSVQPNFEPLPKLMQFFRAMLLGVLLVLFGVRGRHA